MTTKTKRWSYQHADVGDDHWFTLEVPDHFTVEHAEWTAEDAAEDYHSNHDGWEYKWPLTFRIRDENGRDLGEWEVSMEMVPSFSARHRSDRLAKPLGHPAASQRPCLGR